jgi:predicted tellurium resistance membrane protein TerC
MDVLLDPGALLALLTLTILEIVLGIDNVIFIAIVTSALPEEKQGRARTIGLALALLGRIAMVLGVSWLISLDETLFTVLGHDISISGLILIGGGLFLIYKATREIFITTELREEQHATSRRATSTLSVIGTIVVIDMIFAIDSVLTAIGLTSEIVLIIIAITIAILIMMFYAGPVSRFIQKHVSLKILALSFLVVIGLMLLLDGVGEEVDRNIVYAAILFALGVEYLNFRRRRNLERRAALAAEAAVAGEDEDSSA